MGVDDSVEDDNSDVGVVTCSSNDDAVGVSKNQMAVRDRIKKFKNCTDAMPSDPVLVRLLGKMQPQWLLGYADHDALATGEGESELSTEEQAVAWAEYEAAEAASKAQEEAEAAHRVEMAKRAADHQNSLNTAHITSATSALPQREPPFTNLLSQHQQKYVNTNQYLPS